MSNLRLEPERSELPAEDLVTPGLSSVKGFDREGVLEVLFSALGEMEDSCAKDPKQVLCEAIDSEQGFVALSHVLCADNIPEISFQDRSKLYSLFASMSDERSLGFLLTCLVALEGSHTSSVVGNFAACRQVTLKRIGDNPKREVRRLVQRIENRTNLSEVAGELLCEMPRETVLKSAALNSLLKPVVNFKASAGHCAQALLHRWRCMLGPDCSGLTTEIREEMNSARMGIERMGVLTEIYSRASNDRAELRWVRLLLSSLGILHLLRGEDREATEAAQLKANELEIAGDVFVDEYADCVKDGRIVLDAFPTLVGSERESSATVLFGLHFLFDKSELVRETLQDALLIWGGEK